MPFSLVEVYIRFGGMYCLGYGLGDRGNRVRFVVQSQITTEEYHLLRCDAV
jgi:hypothetical protein